ncbi:MAG: TonB-dependent receptor [Vicinamibacteria bacterium]
MMFSRALRLCLCLSLIALAVPTFAQQTGNIVGKVTATDGAVLPGVTVEARSPVLPGPRVTVTGGNGDYRLPALPPGDYTVTFTLSGMQTVTKKVFVQLSQEANADAKLGVGLTEEVTVTGTTTLIDKDSAAIATGLNGSQLSSLPLGTEYRDLLKVIPGLSYTQDTTRGQSSGGSGQDNIYQFDGVNVTLPLFGTLAAEPSSYDIAQVTVIKGGARAVDFNRAGGFTVDSVSKSGTDKWAGQVDYRLQNHKMSADLQNGSLSRFEKDTNWLDVSLGGPLLKDRLYFYGSYYRPHTTRENRANAYGPLPEYKSVRNEGFGKLTFTPTSKILLNLSYRQSKRVDESDLFGQTSAATTGTGTEVKQKIITGDGSWIISPKSYATFKFTKFENPNQGRPDNTTDVAISTAAGARLDLNNLDKIGRFSVPAIVAGQTDFNTFIQPLVDRYGYTSNGVKVGGGLVGLGLQFDNDDFYRDSGQVAYNLTVGDKVRHDLHVGLQVSSDSEDLLRSSNGWGAISVPRGLVFQGRPVSYIAAFQQQSIGLAKPIQSSIDTQNIELNDTIHINNWTINIGALASKDTLYGQGLKEDSSALSGYTLSLGTKYKMYELPFKKMIQPRVSTTWAYNGHDTVYASYAQFKPVPGSLPRAASWARNLATTINAYFDASGVLFATDPVASSSGKLFVPDLDPRTTNEFLVGTARQLTTHLAARVYGRYRKGEHYWEDTNNNARQAFNPPATVPGTSASIPKDLYIPDLTQKLAQIGSGSTYVIADLDGSFTKYWEGTAELEYHNSKGAANMSYTRSHYYGNFDQDNSTTSTSNDANIFIGSSNIGDGAGRQLWDNKLGDLHGDRPHILKVSGTRYLPWKGTAGFFFLAQSGTPWESTNYQIYRPLVGTSTSDTNRYAEPAGSHRTKAHYQLDFKYSQDVKLTDRFKLQFEGNLYNVFNRQTGYNIQPSVNVPATYGRPQSFYDPRRLELTARVRF